MRIFLATYLMALIPRAILIAYMGIVHPETGMGLLYDHRFGAFWDQFPQDFYRVMYALAFHQHLLCIFYFGLLTSFISPIVYAIAKEFKFSSWVSWCAAGIAAVYPYYVSLAWFQPDRGITILFTSLTVLLFVRLLFQPSWKRMFLQLLVFFILLADRVNAITLILFCIIFTCLYWHNRDVTFKRYKIPYVVFFIVGLLFFCSSNYLRYGYFSLGAKKTGYNLIQGHNAYIGDYLRGDRVGTSEGRMMGDALLMAPMEIQEDPANPKYDDILVRLGVNYALDHPKETLVNLYYKFIRYWDYALEDADHDARWKQLGYTIPYIILMFFGFWGSIRLWREKQFLILNFIWGALIVYSIPCLVAIPLVRVRMYSEFLIFLLAALGLEALLALWRRKPTGA